MAGSSTKVVYAALAGNLLVMGAKFVAAAMYGSSVMLTEAFHSSAGCANQMLLIGDARSRRPADEDHPFGYGGEVYFWASAVAMIVLVAGAGASLFEGVRHVLRPDPIRAPVWSMAVLLLSALFEGGSFRTLHMSPGLILAFVEVPPGYVGSVADLVAASDILKRRIGWVDERIGEVFLKLV